MSHYVRNRYRRPRASGGPGRLSVRLPPVHARACPWRKRGQLWVPASAGMTDNWALYVLNHSQHNFRQRTTQADLDEIEDWTDRAARRMYEGAGLGPEDVDIFNPYDGYAPMAQFFLEAFQWHGVKTRRCLRVLRGRYQGRGTAPVLFERRQFGERAHPYGHVHRQHRAAPRHGWRTAGQGSGRDGAGGIHHAKQWRLDHVRQIPDLTACDTGDHRLAAINLSACLKNPRRQSSAATGRFRIRRRPLSLSVGNR